MQAGLLAGGSSAHSRVGRTAHMLAEVWHRIHAHLVEGSLVAVLVARSTPLSVMRTLGLVQPVDLAPFIFS